MKPGPIQEVGSVSVRPGLSRPVGKGKTEPR
jgi:hypothetical protein